MVDPFSVSTGCVGLLAAVAQLSVQISTFISSVRDARRDMDAVSRELTSLALCLETLRDDSMKITYPDSFRGNLLAVLGNCDAVTKHMVILLRKLSSANLSSKIRWTTTGKDDMNKLRSSLESHKNALEIALDMTSLLLISAVKEDVADVKIDTSAIRANTAQISSIKQDTSQIEVLIQEIGFLRLQLNTSSADDAKAQHLQRFLDQSTLYAETVIDSIEYDGLPGPSRSFGSRITNEQMQDDDGSKAVEGPSENANATNCDDILVNPLPSLASKSGFYEGKPPFDVPRPAKATPISFPEREHLSGRENDRPSVREERQPDQPAATAVQDASKLAKSSLRDRDGTSKVYLGTNPRTAPLVPHRGYRKDGSKDTNGLPDASISMQMRNLSKIGQEGAKQHLQQQSPFQISPHNQTHNLTPPPTARGGRSALSGKLLRRSVRSPTPAIQKEWQPTSEEQRQIAKASEARNRLRSADKVKLDKRLEVAVRGKKTLSDRMTMHNFWMSRDVASLSEIRDLLDQGANPKYHPPFELSIFSIERQNANRLDVLELLLKRGAIMSSPYMAGELLPRAAQDGNEDLVQILLSKGAAVDFKDADGNTALSLALSLNKTDIVNILLQGGAKGDPNTLYQAIEHGYADITKTLLDRGLPVNAKDDSGNFLIAPAMRLAARYGNIDTIKVLLQHDAPADDGALCEAAEAGHAHVVEALIAQGARVNAKAYPNTSVKPRQVSLLNLSATALASRNGHVEIVELLLKHGATADAEALWMAALSDIDHRTDLVRLLLDNGASVNSTYKSKTVLRVAVDLGDQNVVKMLMDRGAKVRDIHFRSIDTSACMTIVAKTKMRELLNEKYREQQASKST